MVSIVILIVRSTNNHIESHSVITSTYPFCVEYKYKIEYVDETGEYCCTHCKDDQLQNGN